MYESAVLCSDTTIRLLPLLTTFAKLKRIYVGGLLTQGPMIDPEQLYRYSYHPSFCSSPENHEELAKAFYHSFLGAFKARLLSPTLYEAKGVLTNFYHLKICSGSTKGENENNGSKGMCTTCRDICSYFPPQEIIDQPYHVRCAEEMEVYGLVSKRKGTREDFRKASGEFLPSFLEERFLAFYIENEGPREAEALSRRLTDFGMSRDDDKCIFYLTKAGINKVDRLIEFGFDPRAVSKESLYDGLLIGEAGRQYDVYAKSTIDALVARGFAFDEADLIVLDETMEPALKDLPARIRGDSY